VGLGREVPIFLSFKIVVHKHKLTITRPLTITCELLSEILRVLQIRF